MNERIKKKDGWLTFFQQEVNANNFQWGQPKLMVPWAKEAHAIPEGKTDQQSAYLQK